VSAGPYIYYRAEASTNNDPERKINHGDIHLQFHRETMGLEGGCPHLVLNAEIMEEG